MILVDSDILIAHLRGLPAARAWLIDVREQTGRLAVSAISITEITGGMRSAERSSVWHLLDSMQVEPVSEIVSRDAGDLMRKYRRSHGGIGLADYLIAATARSRGLEFATLNVKHFPMFARLRAPFRVPT